MKKFIYLLAISLSFVNFSCASLFSNSANGLCNCTCPACLNCTGKHHIPLTVDQQAKQDSVKAEQEKRKAALDSLLSMDYTIVHYEVKDPEPYVWEENEMISTPKEDLLATFRAITKSAANGGHTEYVHSNINTDYKENDFYFYFVVKDGVPEPLRFVAHYYADDPINFNKLMFTIDGFKYEYVPKDLNRRNEGKFYSENFDNQLDAGARDLVAALGRGQYANMLLVSEDGVSHRIFFTEKQLKNFRDTYQLYRLLGGKL